ncbi:MAG: ATP synthase F1 subunit gamma [Candidatus Melainabacteria bacterium]|nr:MAG: ATP synthase F1 subunit gamma [Candidatus Melainabacteria bacterium]
MPNLKAIRNRIKSVQATQKITRAMRLVAAAKVRRAQMRVEAARPFTTAVVKMLQEAVSGVAPIDLQGMDILQTRDVKSVGLIVISSDRGLCGSYNTTVFREAMQRIMQLQKEGKEVKLILVGLKAAGFFKSIKIEKLKSYTLLPAVPSIQESELIADTAVQFFRDKVVDKIEIVGTKFISMMRSEIINSNFIPVKLPEKAQHSVLRPERLFEPSIEEVMQKELLPKYLQNVIYQTLLEASAAELAARMKAMTDASNNARDLIASLSLVYNKARQGSITQELLEIVGGAEALKG